MQKLPRQVIPIVGAGLVIPFLIVVSLVLYPQPMPELLLITVSRVGILFLAGVAIFALLLMLMVLVDAMAVFLYNPIPVWKAGL